MARQQFEQGQRVYVKRYSDHYGEAEVVKPDVVHSAGYGSRTRNIHYVEVVYCRNGKPDGNTWSVLNNRNQIIPSEAYTEIERGRKIDRLRSTVQIHTRWEEKFTAYTEQAKDIIGHVRNAGRADVLELLVALHLKGTFDLRTERSRHTTEEVAELRAERKADAKEAQRTLDEANQQSRPDNVT